MASKDPPPYHLDDHRNPWYNPRKYNSVIRKTKMPIIAVSNIVISKDRQRQEFEPIVLQDLSVSIQKKGLFHAPVLRDISDEDVEKDSSLISKRETHKMLVSGERRLRAIADMRMLTGVLIFNEEKIPDGFVPFVNLGDLSELDAEEAELDENYHRADLTWAEKGAADRRLHILRQKQAKLEGRVHTVKDTALEVLGRCDGAYGESMRQSLIVQNHMDNPAVAKAKTMDEAYKIVLRTEETKRYVESAAIVGLTFSAEQHECHNVDCLSWMRTCDPDQFDVILTDPPYGLGADHFGNSAGRSVNNEHHYVDSYENWLALMRQWCPLSFRVTKAMAHAYVFCDQTHFEELKSLMMAAGWYVFRTMLIHNKPESGRVPLPDMGPRRQYETLLYAIKGKKQVTAIYPDVINSFADKGNSHGAQKPVSLFENLLKRSVRAGDLVLDSFAGSGPIFPAANNLQCRAVGLEKEKEYYGICLERLKELAKPAALVGQNGGDLMNELKGLMGNGGAE